MTDGDDFAGSVTTVASNPFWVIQTTQTTAARTNRPLAGSVGTAGTADNAAPRHSFVQTVQTILKTGGLKAFWRGLMPALVLVVNPVLQYTVFEQLKNALVRRRTTALRAAAAKGSTAAGVVAVLSDLDYFFLGALAKLGAFFLVHRSFLNNKILNVNFFLGDCCY
jgi:solute carrier family 25 (peroxisomal adenine nucleotide transporter), member 17